MTWLTLIIICLVGFFIFMNTIGNKETIRQNFLSKKIKNIYQEHDYIPEKEFLSLGNDSLIAYSDDGRFCFINIKNALDTNTDNHSYKYSFIHSKNIIEVEVFKDNESVINVSKLGLVSGSIAGGLIAGSVGSIIGGMIANKKNTNKIKELSLKITVLDKVEPIKKINIFSNKKGLQGEKYTQDAINEIDYWFNLMKVIIHENKQNNVSSH